MDNLAGHSISVFLAFFAVMNPIANAAVFVGLTGDDDAASRKKIALKSITTAFCIIVFFCVLGKAIFELFGIGILGKSGMDVVTRLMGLILAVVGTQMLIAGIYGARNLF
jgi:multiple antibiotic resistance protein